MPNLDWLDRHHSIYDSHFLASKREERRLFGGDAVLDELIQFAHEESTAYGERKGWARWTGFGKSHVSLLSGHLRRATPIPNFGELGEVRTREETEGEASLAELFFYNCDGVGSDGSQLPSFMDGVEQRALATGYRWLMVEMPSAATLDAIRTGLGQEPQRADGTRAPTTDQDVRAGFRPFLVEYSPLSVTNWRFRDGVLVWAVIRMAMEEESDLQQNPVGADGYYVLVRKGYKGLGPDYEEGGWWKYRSDKQLMPDGHARWDDTDGQIPMWLHLGEPGTGTWERPSIGQSSTMELGQISADLMNAVSEQRHNARQAAKSINYFLGIDNESHTKVLDQQLAGSISVAVKAARVGDEFIAPVIWNSSEGALATEVYQTIITLAMQEAKEIMVRQVTAGPDASGARVEADHAQNTAPLLARIAATAEQSWNTLLYFVARRFGILRPTASVVLPREFELRPVLDSIEQMLATLTASKEGGVRSGTWERALLVKQGDELDLIPEDEREKIEGELEQGADEAAKLALVKLRAEALKALVDAGAIEEEAAKEVGFTDAEAERLFGNQAEMPEIGPDGRPVPPPNGNQQSLAPVVPQEQANRMGAAA